MNIIRATVFEHPDQADYLSLTTNEITSTKPLLFQEVGSTTKIGFALELCRKWFPDFSEKPKPLPLKANNGNH